jgi:xanthosine utilization system XapX-like protein
MTPAGSMQARIIGTSSLIAGLAAFVTGLVSLIKLRDRSPAVIATVVLGALAVLVTLMEAAEGLGR